MSNEIIPTLDLLRFATNKDYTLGLLQIGNMPVGFSLELDWEGNQNNVSCIPAGNYICRWIRSEKFDQHEVLYILDVKDRSDCEVHYGNWIYQIQGCILVGSHIESFSPFRGGDEKKPTGGVMIQNSIAKLAELRRLFPDEELLLRISWASRTLYRTN